MTAKSNITYQILELRLIFPRRRLPFVGACVDESMRARERDTRCIVIASPFKNVIIKLTRPVAYGYLEHVETISLNRQ